MTSDRRNKRSSREIKLNLESLGERIAPAVYHPGFVSLNLVVQHHKPHHNREIKVDRFETTKTSNSLVVSTNPVLLPMDKPTIVTTTPTNNRGPVVSTNLVLLPMDKPPIVSTTSSNNNGQAGSTSPVTLPMDKPTIVTTTPTDNSGPVVPSEKVSLPMDKPSIVGENVAQSLVAIYNQYEQDPAAFTGSTSPTSGVLVQGDQVGIQVHYSNPAEFQDLLTELTNAGMNITLSSPTYGLALGLLPISELLTVAQFSQNLSINPETAPGTK